MPTEFVSSDESVSSCGPVPIADNNVVNEENISNPTEIVTQSDSSIVTTENDICMDESVANSRDTNPLLNDSTANREIISNSTEIVTQNEENVSSDLSAIIVDKNNANDICMDESVTNSRDITPLLDVSSANDENISSSTEDDQVSNDRRATTIDDINTNNAPGIEETVVDRMNTAPLLNASAANQENVTEIVRENAENFAILIDESNATDTISLCDSVANGNTHKESVDNNGSVSTLPAYDSRSISINGDEDSRYALMANGLSVNADYVKLNKVMYIFSAAVLLLSIQAYLSMILAFIYVYNAHYWFFSATYATILGSNLFIVSVSRIWKYSKEENIIQIIISGLASVITSAEIQVYYQDCNRLHKLTLLHNSRAYYKQTLQHVDDLRYLLCMVTALQAVPQFFIQLSLMFLNSTEYYFVLPLQITVMVFAACSLVCAIVTYFSCNYNEELGEKHRVSLLGLLLTCLSDCFYLLDIGSDIILVHKFFCSQQYLYACLTLSFITIPGYYITWLSHSRSKRLLRFNLSNLVKIVFNLDPVSGYWKSLKLIRKVKKIELNEPLDTGYSEERKRCHVELVENNFSVTVLRYNESYTEAAMQLILQIAILLGQFDNFSDFFHEDVLRSKGFQMLSVVSSLINLAIGSVVMFRSKRINRYIHNEELQEDDPLKLPGMIIQFMGYFPVMVTRILAISFAASKFPAITTAVICVNWIIVFGTLRPNLNVSTLIYTLGQSAIYTFTPPINDLCIELRFHTVYLLENIAGTLAWALARHPDPTPLAVCLPVSVIFLINVIGIAFRVSYRKYYEKFMKIAVD
ncbi:hypothetical protein CBL_09880 [Carabus blaptoides fortunei]